MLTAAILLAGCANVDIHLRSASSSAGAASMPPAGTSYSTAAFRADVTPGGYLALLLFGHYMAGFDREYRDGRYGIDARKAPELAADRNVIEMDCSQPLEWPSGNLRCK